MIIVIMYEMEVSCVRIANDSGNIRRLCRQIGGKAQGNREEARSSGRPAGSLSCRFRTMTGAVAEVTLMGAVLLLTISCLFFSNPGRRDSEGCTESLEMFIRSVGCICLMVSFYFRTALNAYGILLSVMSILLLLLSLILEVSLARRELAVPSAVIASLASLLLLFAQDY